MVNQFASEAGVYARQQPMRRAGRTEVAPLGNQLELRLMAGNKGGRHPKAGRGGQIQQTQFEHRFDQRDHAGRTAQVTDLGYDRRHPHRQCPQRWGRHSCLPAIGIDDPLQFLGVQGGAARARGFDHRHVVPPHAGVLAGPIDRVANGLGAGRLVSGADPANDAEDLIAVAAGVGEPLQEDRSAAFAGHDAVGLGIEGSGRAAGRQQSARFPSLRSLVGPMSCWPPTQTIISQAPLSN